MKQLTRSVGLLLLFSILFVALLYSKWLMSLCLILLIPFAILRFEFSPLQVGLRKGMKRFVQFYSEFPPYWGLGLVIIVILLSGLFDGTSGYWQERVRIKAPFLVAPFLFAFFPPLGKNLFRGWIFFVLSLAILSLSLVLGNYFLNYEAMQILLSKGQPIPTPTSHIRYSLFIALALNIGYWLALFENASLKKNSRIFLFLGSTFLFIGLHLLAVRSGLIAGYLGLITLLIYWIITSRKWLIGGLLIAIIFALPVIGYFTIPSLKKKVDYSLYDSKQKPVKDGVNYSDSGRWISLNIGKEIFLENKWTGIGVGSFRTEIKEKYKILHPTIKESKMPHNQFLSILASTGIIGFLGTMFGLLLPLFYKKGFQFFPLTCCYIIMLASMMVENTIESTVGVSLFLIPILIILNYLIGQGFYSKKLD